MTARSLRTTAFASREELADALQCVFVSEVLVPSTPLWIITPWISDVPIIDNRAGPIQRADPCPPATLDSTRRDPRTAINPGWIPRGCLSP